MSKQGKDNSKLEEMLRRWGAQEAAAKVKLPPARSGDGQTRVIIRWTMLSAAAAAVIVVAVWLGSLTRQSGPEDIDMQDKLAKVQEESNKFYTQWKESDKQLREQTARVENALREVQSLKTQAAPPNARIDELQRNVADLQKSLDQEKEQHKVTLAALEVAKRSAGHDVATRPDTPQPAMTRDVAALQDKVIRLEAQVGNYEDRVAAAASELTRLKQANEDWAAKVQTIQDELAAAKLAAAREFEQSQAAYLATAAPTEHGLKARQSASKRARLVQRISAARRGDPPQALVPVLDRLEVVLTRLDMIDAFDSHAAQGFVKLLDNGGLVQRIDLAMAAPHASTEVLNVLAEAKMILAGAENVL
jgi:DNA repair exonuclease SbcCD ATPase subunit